MGDLEPAALRLANTECVCEVESELLYASEEVWWGWDDTGYSAWKAVGGKGAARNTPCREDQGGPGLRD
jgi:hypothetical protein